MSQVQELQAIDRFVARFKPTTPFQQKLIADWKSWYPNLTFYERNLDGTKLQHAIVFRNTLTSGFGAESKAKGNYEKKGTHVPIPSGYRRALANEISPTVQGFAKAALAKFGEVSKKKGEAKSIGMRYSAVVGNKEYLSQCEWHFDNHPKGGVGPAYWHMGSSIFVPIKPAAKQVESTLFRTSDPTLASLSKTSNPYA